jgi:hypothetical protein
MIKQEDIDKLVAEIAALEKERQLAYEEMVVRKKALSDAEGVMIDINITRDILKEKLRVLKSKKVDSEISDRENDIERFRKVMPELLQKIKS